MTIISIRHSEPTDAEAIHRILTAPRAVAGTLQLPHQSLERVRQRWTNIDDGRYSLVAVAEGEVVGTLGLVVEKAMRRRHVGSIGMSVRDDWQGRGVGTALLAAALDLADNWLHLTRVELHVYTDNAAGLALYRKFGFEIEGTHPAYAFRDGRYVDSHSMARVRP